MEEYLKSLSPPIQSYLYKPDIDSWQLTVKKFDRELSFQIKDRIRKEFPTAKVVIVDED